MNKNKELFVESISSLRNSFYLTSVAKSLGGYLDKNSVVAYIMSHKNDDGGFGHDNYSTIPDTYFALATLDNVNSLHVSKDTLSFLKLNDSFTGSYLEYVYWHFMSYRMLGYFPNYTDKLESYMYKCQRTNGGFSRSIFQGISTFEDTYYAVSVLKEVEKYQKKISLFNMQNFITFVITGLIFSPFAGLMAGLITHEEWKHHYMDNRQPMKETINTGIFAFLVFLGMTVIVGSLLDYIITP